MSKKNTNVQIVVVCLIYGCSVVRALQPIHNMLLIREHLLNSFDRYISREEERLNLLREKWQDSKGLTTPFSSEALNDPMTHFMLIKALVVDTENIFNLLYDSSNEEVFNSEIYELKSSQKFPTDQDLENAVKTIVQLQRTYHLQTQHLVHGCLNEETCVTSALSVEDIVKIGESCYEMGHLELAMEWINQAAIKLENKEGLSNALQKNYDNDVKRVKDFLVTIEETKTKMELGENFLSTLNKQELNVFHERVWTEAEAKMKNSALIGLDPTRVPRHLVESDYGTMCGKDHFFENSKSNLNFELHCYFSHQQNPYFWLGRGIKTELLSISPPLYKMHEFIHESEITTLMQSALTKFLEGSSIDHETIDKPSQRTYVNAFDNPLLHRLMRRIELMSNFQKPLIFDHYEISRYDVGDHFVSNEQHIEEVRGKSNIQLAVWKLNLNGFFLGGPRAFPNLNLTDWPEVGSAILWYDMMSDGVQMQKMPYMECPVALGEKWIASAWVEETTTPLM